MRGATGWGLAATAAMVLAAALLTSVGLAALTGASAFESNVREIESNEDFGDLYLSLAGWGGVALIAGLAELVAAVAYWARPGPGGRLAALVVAYFGLPVAFFTLPLFRLWSVAIAALLLVAIWILSYRCDPGTRPRA